MHPESMQLMEQFKKYLDETGRKEPPLKVLDVGSYRDDGRRCYRELFQEHEYIGMDIRPGPNVNQVEADPENWSFANDTFDVVISGQVIEHVARPWVFIKECARVLKPGGFMCIIAPTKGREHRHPIDGWRIYPDGMNVLANEAGLSVVMTTWWKEKEWGDLKTVMWKPD